MRAQPVLMDTTEESNPPIPFSAGSMHIGGQEYRVKLYEHIPVDPETWKPGQFDPDREWTDIEITAPDCKTYWGNVEAIGFLNTLFKQDKANRHQQPVYSEKTLTSLVKRADIPTVTAYFKIIIGELGFETLCAKRKLERLERIETPESEQEKPPLSGKTYKKWRAEYYSRFAHAQVPVTFPDNFDKHNGRVKVYLKTEDGGMLASQFVSVGYLNRILKEHQETGKTTIDRNPGEIYTPYGIHIPYFVVLKEISQGAIRETIDSMIQNFEIGENFRVV